MARYAIFLDTLTGIELHNAQYEQGLQTYTQGINFLADLYPSEKAHYHGYAPSASDMVSQRFNLPSISSAQLKPTKPYPSSLDYRNHQCMPDVKNQGRCSCCWAFSATMVMEFGHCMVNKKLPRLSEQQLVSCISGINGNVPCKTDSPSSAYDYVRKNGLVTHKTVEYVSGYTKYTGSCSITEQSPVAANIDGWSRVNTIGDASDEAMIAALNLYGPLSVMLYSSGDWGLYKSGVYQSNIFSGKCKTENHAVNLVGYGYDDATKLDYWIVRNQWGSKWGLDGYILMARGSNQCNINNYPQYVKMKKI